MSESKKTGPSLVDNSGRPNKRPRTKTETMKEDNSNKSKISPSSAPPLEIAPPPMDESNNNSVINSMGESTANRQQVIILLDQARLETVKNRRGDFELLNCDDHRDLCRKKLKKDPKDYRPDICHQELLALIDSPLNKAGCLRIYIKTIKNVLIEVHPSVRIPRTYRRFSGLMVQLLHKMKIKASDTSTTLLKVIKNPFSQYLPAGTRVLGMSCQGTLYSPAALASSEFVPSEMDLSSSSTSEVPPVCFVVGAMATGHVTLEDHPYIEKMISISEYPLSGAAALSRICGAIEHQWGIV